MRSRQRVARADDWRMDITQMAWEQSQNIIRSPEVRDRNFQIIF